MRRTRLECKAARLIIVSLIAFIHLSLANVRAESGQAPASTGYIEPHPLIHNPTLKTPPVITPQIRQAMQRCADHPLWPTPEPVDPSVPLDKIAPLSPASIPRELPQNQNDKDPGTFRFFLNTSLPDASTADFTSSIDEPSVGVNRNAVFYTGNWFASVSGDGGQTFTFVNPFDNFPADGTPDPVNGGFCCDQSTYYDESHNALFWELLYIDDGSTNTIRIAVANSESNIVNNAWSWYDFSPANIGYPASGFWFDFPDITTSNNFLYLTVNVFAIGAGTTSTAAILRLPLTEMSQGLGLSFNYFVTDRPSIRCTKGATSTIYFAAHNSNTNIRIYHWDEGSGTVFWDNVAHTAYNTGAMVATDPSGHNFAGRSDTRILSAWVANGVLGFMWNAAQGGSFPYPHVETRLFDEATRALTSESQIWSPGLAWLYPSAHPNWRGHVGGTVSFGGGSYYPSSSAWIADDFNGNSYAPLENVATIFGNAGSNRDAWGDFLSARRNTPFGYTWSATSYALIDGGGDNSAVPMYTWFGRERDCPGFLNKDALTLNASDLLVCQNQGYCINWGRLVGATGYQIEENGVWFDVGNTTSWCTAKEICGDYAYRVRGVNPCNVSGASNYVTVTVKCAPLSAPTITAPQTVCQDPLGIYCLSWSAVPDASSYQVQTNGGDWFDLGDNINTCAFADLCGDFTYSIRAVNECGIGPASNPWTVRVLCPPTNAVIESDSGWFCGVPANLNADAGGIISGFLWESSCGGTFSSPTGNSTTWTPPNGFSGSCDIKVTVSNDCGQSSAVLTKEVQCNILCGDIDGSATVNLGDAVYYVQYIFANGPPPQDVSGGDINCDGRINLSDIVFLVNYIFGDGPAPCTQCINVTSGKPAVPLILK